MNPTFEESILKYENFINDVLKEDLRGLEERLTRINAKISVLIEQQQTLKVVTDKKIHPDGFKAQVNLGSNFFMEATVPDTSTMLINIGLNYYLEFSVPEAEKYLDSMIKAYEAKAVELRSKVAETTAHIKLMLLRLDELVNENKKGWILNAYLFFENWDVTKFYLWAGDVMECNVKILLKRNVANFVYKTVK